MTATRRRVAALVVVVLLIALTTTPSVSSTYTDHPGPVSGHVVGPGQDAPADAGTNLSAVHESGITGEGVRFGVIGRQFAPGTANLGPHVADARGFTAGPALRLGSAAHDTAVAEIVARTAPGADLYLASVGSHPTPEEYADAVAWLLERDVDVIVDSASYFPRSGAAAERMNAVASRATSRGVVFVTSAGNYADRHWGSETSGPGWVSFEPGVQANPLGNGSIQGRVTLRLYWQSGADYDLYLYRYRANGPDPVVAKSTARQTGAGAHAESVDALVPRGKYYVAVYGRENTSVETRLDLFASTHRLRYTVAAGSMVAPATADNVIAVGAVAPGTGHVQPYSSQGAALDVVAPDGARTRAAGVLYGTSAAAPLVAGTAALMEAQHGNLTPAEAERILVATAVRTDGRLRLDPAAAISAATGGNVTLATVATSTTNATTSTDTPSPDDPTSQTDGGDEADGVTATPVAP